MTESLYERLGGTEGCNQLASDLVDIHLANPAISARYVNSDPAALKHGAAVNQLRHPAAELVAGINHGQGFRPLGDGVSRQ